MLISTTISSTSLGSMPNFLIASGDHLIFQQLGHQRRLGDPPRMNHDRDEVIGSDQRYVDRRAGRIAGTHVARPNNEESSRRHCHRETIRTHENLHCNRRINQCRKPPRDKTCVTVGSGTSPLIVRAGGGVNPPQRQFQGMKRQVFLSSPCSPLCLFLQYFAESRGSHRP